MKRVWSLSAALSCLLALPALSQENKQDQKTLPFLTRSILRKNVQRDGKVSAEFAKQTGLKNVTELTYKILVVQSDGTLKPVRPDQHTFNIGDQFKVEISCGRDLFIYIFNQDMEGKRVMLMPDKKFDKDRVPMAKKDEAKTLPDDDSYFEFVPPGGTEKLLIFASPEAAGPYSRCCFQGLADAPREDRVKNGNREGTEAVHYTWGSRMAEPGNRR